MSVTENLQREQVQWLVEVGRELLSRASIQTARGLMPWQKSLLEQQLQLRWRSRNRFPAPERWLWTDNSLAQASDAWCATYKASLFPLGEAVVDACCGAGSDLVALAARGETRGMDLNPCLAILAEDNARAHGYDVTVDRLSLPEAWPANAQWLSIDPDRRATGKRTTAADLFCPSLEAVLNMAASCRGAVIKLAPSTRINDVLRAELELCSQRVWLGNQGECRQQILLTGELRRSGLRAAVLCERSRHERSTAHITATELEVHHYSGPTQANVAFATKPQRFVYDLHSVLHAAELQTTWASAHHLSCLGGEHGYFTGTQLLTSPWLQSFEVIDVIAWDDRKVRKWLRAFDAGLVEIKSRLVKLDANASQRRYSAASGRPVTLLVTRIEGRVRAIAAVRTDVEQLGC